MSPKHFFPESARGTSHLTSPTHAEAITLAHELIKKENEKQ